MPALGGLRSSNVVIGHVRACGGSVQCCGHTVLQPWRKMTVTGIKHMKNNEGLSIWRGRRT